MRGWCYVLGTGLSLALTGSAIAQGRTYGGFDCTVDCSGHSAGYKWAERKGITDETDCPLPNNSPSFQEGCIAYTQDSGRIDPDADDDDDMVGPSSRKSMDADDDDDDDQ